MSVLILIVYMLMIGSSKNNRKNYPRKCCRTQEKKPGLNLTLGKSLIGLRTPGPRCKDVKKDYLLTDHVCLLAVRSMICISVHPLSLLSLTSVPIVIHEFLLGYSLTDDCIFHLLHTKPSLYQDPSIGTTGIRF